MGGGRFLLTGAFRTLPIQFVLHCRIADRIATADTPSYQSTDNYRHSDYQGVQTNIDIANTNVTGTNVTTSDNSYTINMMSEAQDNEENINLPATTSDSSSLITNNAVGEQSPIAVSPSRSFETCPQQKANSASLRTETKALQPTQIVLEGNNKVSVIKVGERTMTDAYKMQ